MEHGPQIPSRLDLTESAGTTTDLETGRHRRCTGHRVSRVWASLRQQAPRLKPRKAITVGAVTQVVSLPCSLRQERRSLPLPPRIIYTHALAKQSGLYRVHYDRGLSNEPTKPI